MKKIFTFFLIALVFVFPASALGVGNYTVTCDYAVTADDGQTYYIPSEFVNDYNIMIVNNSVSGDIRLIASNSSIELPSIREDEGSYYKTWAQWPSNENADTIILTVPKAVEDVFYSVDSVNSTGTALGTDTAGNYVIWSNFDVLDSDGTIYHAENSVETGDSNDFESSDKLSGGIETTNSILMAILIELTLYGAFFVFRLLLGR